MQFTNLLSNFSLLTSSLSGISHLRNYILTEAVSGSFSKTKPDSWKKTTLGAEVDIIRGITFPSSAKHREPSEDRIVCLRTTNVQDLVDWVDLLYVPESYVKNDNQYIRMNDILISMANSRELVGKVSLVTRDDIRCTLGGFIAAIRCSKTILPEFLMILLRVPATKEKIIDSSTQTTNIANISLGRLRPLQINLPTMQEQLNIVNKVSQLFDKCDQLETSLSDMQTLSKSTRRSAIDAVSTAQTSEDLHIAWERIHNNWKAITGTTESVESLRMLVLDLAIRGNLTSKTSQMIIPVISTQESPFSIPAHWKWCTLQEITEDLGQETPVSEFSYIDVASINNRTGTISEDLNVLSAKNAPSRARKRVAQGSVLFSTVRPYLRNIAIVNREFTPKAIASTAFAVLYPIKSVSPDFLFICLRSNFFKTFVESKQKGVAYPAINGADLKSALLPIPPLAEQEQIIGVVTNLLNLCDQLEHELSQRSSLADKFSRSITAITG